MTTAPIPEGYRTITPQLAVDRAGDAIAFYERAFGAVVVDKALDPSGAKIWHASLRIGDSMIFVNDVFPEMGAEPSRSEIWLYVPDVDAAFKRAVDAGAKTRLAPTDMFWGDRMANVEDGFGQRWTLATRIKDLTPAEMKEAEAAFVASMKSHP